MRTLTTKEYELLYKIYNSTDETEANLSFEFGIQNDTYYQLFHSYTEGEKSWIIPEKNYSNIVGNYLN